MSTGQDELTRELQRQLWRRAASVDVERPPVADLLIESRVRLGRDHDRPTTPAMARPSRASRPAFLAAAAALVVAVFVVAFAATAPRETQPSGSPTGRTRPGPPAGGAGLPPGAEDIGRPVPPPPGTKPLHLELDLDGATLRSVVNTADGSDAATLDSAPSGRTGQPTVVYRSDPTDPAAPSFMVSPVHPALVELTGAPVPPRGVEVIDFEGGRGWFDTLPVPAKKFVVERDDRLVIVTAHGLSDDQMVEVAQRATWVQSDLMAAELDGFVAEDVTDHAALPYATLHYDVGEFRVELAIAFGDEATRFGSFVVTDSAPVRGRLAAVSQQGAIEPLGLPGAYASWYEADHHTKVSVGVTARSRDADPARIRAVLDRVLGSVVTIDAGRWGELVHTHPPPDHTWSCDPAPGACRAQALADLDHCHAWYEEHLDEIAIWREQDRARTERALQAQEEAVARGETPEPYEPHFLADCPRPTPPPHYEWL